MKTEAVTTVKVRTVKELEKIQMDRAEEDRRISAELEMARKQDAIKKVERKIFVRLNNARKNMKKLPDELRKIISGSCANYTANIEALRRKFVAESLAAYNELSKEKKSPEDFQEYLDKTCFPKATAASAPSPSYGLAEDMDGEEDENK